MNEKFFIVNIEISYLRSVISECGILYLVAEGSK